MKKWGIIATILWTFSEQWQFLKSLTENAHQKNGRGSRAPSQWHMASDENRCIYSGMVVCHDLSETYPEMWGIKGSQIFARLICRFTSEGECPRLAGYFVNLTLLNASQFWWYTRTIGKPIVVGLPKEWWCWREIQPFAKVLHYYMVEVVKYCINNLNLRVKISYHEKENPLKCRLQGHFLSDTRKFVLFTFLQSFYAFIFYLFHMPA